MMEYHRRMLLQWQQKYQHILMERACTLQAVLVLIGRPHTQEVDRRCSCRQALITLRPRGPSPNTRVPVVSPSVCVRPESRSLIPRDTLCPGVPFRGSIDGFGMGVAGVVSCGALTGY